MRKIILCADDFGLNAGVNRGILNLCENHRINAVSCLMNFPEITNDAEALKQYADTIDIGLHVNLTEGVSLNHQKDFTPLNNLIMQAYMLQLNLTELIKEISHQMEAFIELFQCKPKYIDGHQHIQQLPQIREALIKVYQQYFPDNNAYIRLSKANPFKYYNFPKPLSINLLGSKQLQNLLEQNHIPYNKNFAGIYGFSDRHAYRVYFQKFLKEIGDNGIIMCHPGLPDTTTQDIIAAARKREYDYLISEEFIEDIAWLADVNDF